MELGIWLSFVKTSEFRGGGGLTPKRPPRYATGTDRIETTHAATGVVFFRALMPLFWVYEYRRFEGTYCFCLHGVAQQITQHYNLL
jgi:hypothetical protein